MSHRPCTNYDVIAGGALAERREDRRPGLQAHAEGLHLQGHGRSQLVRLERIQLTYLLALTVLSDM